MKDNRSALGCTIACSLSLEFEKSYFRHYFPVPHIAHEHWASARERGRQGKAERPTEGRAGSLGPQPACESVATAAPAAALRVANTAARCCRFK